MISVQVISEDLQNLLRSLLQKEPKSRLTLEEALDHPWVQLADEEEGLDATMAINGYASLRTRAYSYQQIYVTDEEVKSAIRSVNNFVLLVRKLMILYTCS